ncbi:hypothetical protein D3C84_1006100 [compost metagenome]
MSFEIVQRRVQQRNRPGAIAGLDWKPWRLSRNIQAQEGFPDVQIEVEAGFQRVLEQGFGKGTGVLQVCQPLVDVILCGPVRSVECLEL